MQTTIPLYGFGGGSGGIGATLTVTAPAGCTVTVSKDGKTKTKTAGADGVAVFKGLATGEWTLTITDGSQTSTKPVVITADYSTVIAFFSATIHVTYPAGSTCTATDGVTTLAAPDASGTWDCVVPNAGTWTISSTAAQWKEEIAVTADGQTFDADVSKLYLQKGASINCATVFTNVYTESLDDGVKYKQNGGNSRCTAHLGPVSLTDATKLCVKTLDGHTFYIPIPGVCVSTALLTGYPSTDLARFTHTSDENNTFHIEADTCTMDISGYSGEYYVALFWEGMKNNDTFLTVEAIWLEI